MTLFAGSLKIEISPVTQMSAGELAQIHDWLWQVFAMEVAEYQWSEADWHLRAWVGERLIGHVDITERHALAGGQPVWLGGVGGVVTLPGWRRLGVAAEMLRQVGEFLRRPLGADFGLLVCRHQLESYYTRQRWQAVPGPLMFDQPGGKVTFNETVMVLPATKTAWPAGIIDLCGLPW